MNGRSVGFAAALLVTALAMCARASVADATPLPTGTWQLAGNGFLGTLQITAIDGNGNLTLSAYGDPTIGFYNSTSNTIQFTRQFGTTTETTQTYTGALMVVEPSPGACTYILTGTFTGYGPSGVSAARPVLAWLALIDAAC